MKYLIKIWPLVILMMIAPVRDASADLVHTDDHEMNLSAMASFRSDGAQGAFILKENTFLIINKHTVLSVKTNLNLHSPISGKGSLILNGDEKLSLDAHGNTISNLVIRNTGGIELLSQLGISQELSVEEGYLYLNDFNLVLNHSFVKISTEGSGEIAFNGTGRIIGQALQPLANQAPQHDRDFSTQAFVNLLSGHNQYLYSTQILYHNIQNCESAFLCPPTPPPD
ncbi:MAG: hypothetical protein ABFS05_10065 [Bacteroidota bacterium]